MTKSPADRLINKTLMVANNVVKIKCPEYGTNYYTFEDVLIIVQSFLEVMEARQKERENDTKDSSEIDS